jgi:hypothetical protein
MNVIRKKREFRLSMNRCPSTLFGLVPEQEWLKTTYILNSFEYFFICTFRYYSRTTSFSFGSMVLRHTYTEKKERKGEKNTTSSFVSIYDYLIKWIAKKEKERKNFLALPSLPDSHYDSLRALPVKHSRMVEHRREEKRGEERKRDHWQFLIVVRLCVCAYSFVWRLLLRFDSMMARRSIKFNNFSFSFSLFIFEAWWSFD